MDGRSLVFQVVNKTLLTDKRLKNVSRGVFTRDYLPFPSASNREALFMACLASSIV